MRLKSPECRLCSRRLGIEGWLFFDFRGQNPIATAMLGLGWTSRRSFTLIPAEGDPVTLIHAIEHSSWRHWPWEIIDYSGWREMESRLPELIAGRKRLAMEVSATFECSHAGSGTVRHSGLAPRCRRGPRGFGELWCLCSTRSGPRSSCEAHRVSAETVRAVAMDAFTRAVEYARRVTNRFSRASWADGFATSWRPEACRSAPIHTWLSEPNAADPHYDPRDAGDAIAAGCSSADRPMGKIDGRGCVRRPDLDGDSCPTRFRTGYRPSGRRFGVRARPVSIFYGPVTSRPGRYAATRSTTCVAWLHRRPGIR